MPPFSARQDGVMLIHDWDAALDDDEWWEFVKGHLFGHLVAPGRHRELPVVVPTQFLLLGTPKTPEIVLHLARPNPIWKALEENPRVLMSVAADWSFIPSSWKAIGDEDPDEGVPTTYYAAVQMSGRAEVVEDPEGKASILRKQLAALQPDIHRLDPAAQPSQLPAIRGIRIGSLEVRAKFKYGGNVDADHRLAVADHLRRRAGAGDEAARLHLLRRLDSSAG
jgi:transcriptional regulator